MAIGETDTLQALLIIQYCTQIHLFAWRKGFFIRLLVDEAHQKVSLPLIFGALTWDPRDLGKEKG